MEIEHWTNGKENDESLVKCTGCQIEEENNNKMCLIRKKFCEGKRALKKGVVKRKEENRAFCKILVSAESL